MSCLVSGYTGRLFEEEVLGALHITWSRGRFVPFVEALRLAQINQSWDPSDPNLRVANDLHAEVALALGLDDWRELRLFSAVNSPLDFFHGVDGWFEFRGRVVTMDVTTNPHKLSAKADFIIRPEDLGPEARPSTARLIAKAFTRTLTAERRYV